MSLAAGQRAPSFKLPDMKGGPRTLDQLLQKGPVALAFFKITCPTCQFTLPFLERLAASDKLQFVAVSQDGVKGTANFLKEYGVKFLTLLDASGYPVSNAYGITLVPTVFVVEQDGKISTCFDGFSKSDVAALGQRAGIEPFQPGDYVPEWKAG